MYKKFNVIKKSLDKISLVNKRYRNSILYHLYKVSQSIRTGTLVCIDVLL